MIYLLGDSIRLGMQKALQNLDTKELINGPKENLGDSNNLLSFLESGSFICVENSLIYLNTGLHDIRFHREEKKPQVELNQYKANLVKAIHFLKRKYPTIKIFIGTTIPFNEVQHNKIRLQNGSPFARYRNDLEKYNHVVKELALGEKVNFIDLYSIYIENNIENFVLEDGLHLREEGYKIMGEKLIQKIKVF